MQKADACEEATAFVGNGIMFELQNRRQNGTSLEQLIAGEADPFMERSRVKRQGIGAGEKRIKPERLNRPRILKIGRGANDLDLRRKLIEHQSGALHVPRAS